MDGTAATHQAAEQVHGPLAAAVELGLAVHLGLVQGAGELGVMRRQGDLAEDAGAGLDGHRGFPVLFRQQEDGQVLVIAMHLFQQFLQGLVVLAAADQHRQTGILLFQGLGPAAAIGHPDCLVIDESQHRGKLTPAGFLGPEDHYLRFTHGLRPPV